MVQGVDIEQVKKYNSQLKGYKEQASRITAQIDYSKAELTNLCNELTAELGKQVTPENIEEVYNEFMSNLKSTLDTGTTILTQIANDGQTQPTSQTAPQVTPQAAPQVNPQMINPVGATTAGAMPTFQQAQQPVTPVAPQPTMGQTQGIPLSDTTIDYTSQPLFKL